MATFVTLYKLTEQGVSNIKESPQRIKAGIKAMEAVGGKVIGFYSTMGEYDFVGIAEIEDEEAAVAFTLALGAQGNIRSTTMRAYTVDDFTRIVGKIPDMA
jgi:uncharacterized protein with GYD domain